jgi:PAS domain-containing protein
LGDSAANGSTDPDNALKQIVKTQGIKERKQAEEALQFTQFAIDRSSDAAFWMGTDARFIYVNNAACNALGYSKEELLTMAVHDIDPDFVKDGTEAVELYKGAIESGKPFEAVILDLTIKEGMGGVNTIKKLMEIDPQARAIVSRGYSNDPVMTDFRKFGFIGALAKPYRKKELCDALKKVSTNDWAQTLILD